MDAKINEIELAASEYETPEESKKVYIADWNGDSARSFSVGDEEINKRLNPKAFGLKYDPWHIISEEEAEYIWAKDRY